MNIPPFEPEAAQLQPQVSVVFLGSGLMLIRGQNLVPSYSAVPLFDLAAVPSPRPCDRPRPARADAVKVGRRSNRAAHSAVARPHLDGGEHAGRLTASPAADHVALGRSGQ